MVASLPTAGMVLLSRVIVIVMKSGEDSRCRMKNNGLLFMGDIKLCNERAGSAYAYLISGMREWLDRTDKTGVGPVYNRLG